MCSHCFGLYGVSLEENITLGVILLTTIDTEAGLVMQYLQLHAVDWLTAWRQPTQDYTGYMVSVSNCTL